SKFAQVGGCVFVKLQRAGQAVENLVGGLMVSSLLEFQVVLGADAGKHGDFFATQTLNASTLAARQADIIGFEQFSASPQETCQPTGCFHRSRLGFRVQERVTTGLPVTM